MVDLKDSQKRFVTVLQHGPSAFPHGLFAGDSERALLGLKAHANTISHARLVALEQAYPRTLAHIGPEAFNAVSRTFVERPDVRQRKLMSIGEDFAEHLAGQGSDPLAADLAAIEWAWLESYHAADSAALRLADLARYDETALLDMPVVLHPAARVVPVASAVTAVLPELEGDNASTVAILVTRPAEAVRLLPLDGGQAAIAAHAKNCVTMGNLLQGAIETAGEAEALPVIFALLEAGLLASPGG